MTEVSPGATRGTAKLRLATRYQTTTYAAREQVGSVAYTNSAGQPAGTAAIYQNRTYTSQQLKWRPYQGDVAIADEDFFRFAGDAEAAEASHSYRRTGRILAWSGTIVTVLSVGAIIVADRLESEGARKAVGASGVLGVIYGPLAAWYGFAHLHPENHAVPYSRAESALQQHEAREPAAFRVPLASGTF